MDEVVIATRGVCRDFGPVRVLFDIDLSFVRGEVHAVIGENGAGKSTLMKILSGYLAPSDGTVLVDGGTVTLEDSSVGEGLGVVLIHQEFNLARHLTVEENVFLGREICRGPLLDKKTMQARAREVLHELATDIDPQTRLTRLSMAQWQMVEIAKALSRNARVLIMDEPTAVLTPSEADVLFELIRKLKKQGVTVIYISHKLEEVKAIADRVTVLRDGRLITTRDAADLTEKEMATLMVGRELQDMYPPVEPTERNETVMSVRGLTVPGWAQEVSFDLKQGEILGFAGLVGAGRTEVMEGLLGLRKHTVDQVLIKGTPRKIRNTRDAAKYGVVYLSEDRKGKGVITSMKLVPNVTLMSLRAYCRPLIDSRAEYNALERAVERFDIRVNNLNTTAGTLSGGNQQKLALGKIMEIDPEIIILDEPTRGIDVGTKREIYFLIAELVRQGKSCILISSELTEIIGVCHRVVVMRTGNVTGVLEREEMTEHEIVLHATGIKHKGEVHSAAHPV